jgi:hypothetical protein
LALRHSGKWRSRKASTADSKSTAAQKNLFVQGNIQFGGKLVGIERATGEKTVANLDCGHFPAAFVYLKDQLLGIDIFVDVHIDEVNSAILQKFLGAVAIHAPTGAVHCDFFHTYLMLALAERIRACLV